MPVSAQVRHYCQRLRALRALPCTGRGRPAHEAEIVRTTCRFITDFYVLVHD